MPARTKRQTRNQNANYYRAGDNNVQCDRTGFKMKASECRFEWNGLYVRKKSWERRHPQDLLRGMPDRQAPDVSRPGTGDRFLGTNEVKAEDL